MPSRPGFLLLEKIIMMMHQTLGHYATRIAQEVAIRTGLAISKPTDVILILTYRCNARCVHCRSYDVPRMQEMTTGEWLRTLDELRDWLGPVFLSFTGGEALLRKDAIDLAAHAADLGFWVEFLSNGWVIDEQKAQRLVNSGIKRMNISLDGSQKQVHDEVRGVKGFYERSSRALRFMAEQTRANERDLQIYAKTAIMSINVDDLSGVVRLAKELGIYGVEFQAIGPIYYSDQEGNPNWYKNNPLWIVDYERVSRALGELKELKEAGYPIINSLENLEMIEAYFRDPRAEEHRVHSHDYKKQKPSCRDWAKGLQIDPAGGMRMCHWMEPFGSARDGGLARMWKTRSSCGRCGRP
jgi:MoaA/NifB/PqqE/SkfB family radical SAM enzyme